MLTDFLKVTAPTQSTRPVNEEDEALNWLTTLTEEAKHKIVSRQVRITPARAKLLLELRNPDNRALSKRVLKNLKADIVDKRYIFNGEPIIVSIDGYLNDGQHRCLAVVQTGIPIDTMITVGVSRDSRLTVDTGKARTTRDFLHMQDVKNARAASQLASLLWQWQKYGDITDYHTQRATKVQTQALYYENREAIDHAINAVPSRGLTVLGSHGVIAFCYMLFHEASPDHADRFLNGVLEGVNLQSNDPIATLRNRLITSASRTRDLRTIRDRVEAYIRAWNAFVRGEALTEIQVNGRMPKVARPRNKTGDLFERDNH